MTLHRDVLSALDFPDRLRAALARADTTTSDYDLNPDVVLPPDRVLREAAVLVPVFEAGGGWHLILTKRSSALKHHPGQIAFPGGKRDPGDADLIATAMREAGEEIGLAPEATNVIGTLREHETVTNFRVTPVIGHVTQQFDPVPEAGEVAEVFTVPLAHILTLDNYFIEGRRWRGTWRRYYAVPYGPYYIWGATARILRAMAETLA